MRGSSKNGYADTTEQFIRSVGMLAVQQALGVAISRQIEVSALGRLAFLQELQKVCSLVNFKKEEVNELGVLYTVTIPEFATEMSSREREGFRAIYANTLVHSLRLKVTEFHPHPSDKRIFSVRLAETPHQELFNKLSRYSRAVNISPG